MTDPAGPPPTTIASYCTQRHSCESRLNVWRQTTAAAQVHAQLVRTVVSFSESGVSGVDPLQNTTYAITSATAVAVTASTRSSAWRWR